MSSNINQHFRNYELFIKQLEEGVNRYQKNYIPQVYGFLGLEKIKVVNKYFGNNVDYSLFGGYDDAFSKRLVIGEDLFAEDYIVCLQASFNNNFLNLSHRDVLGAVYNLGIDEEQFGDMWVEENNVYLYATKEMQQFIIDNLTQINKAHLSFKALDYFPKQEFKFKERQVVISSYRLDKIVTTIIKKSRDKAQSLIKNGLVNVNFQAIEDLDYLCHNCDILSIRGVGRFKIGDEISSTKSGNVIITIKQFV